jgi:serpin B
MRNTYKKRVSLSKTITSKKSSKQLLLKPLTSKKLPFKSSSYKRISSKQITSHICTFGQKLINKMKHDFVNGGMISELSLIIILQMAAYGARGRTQQQMNNVLGKVEHDEINKLKNLPTGGDTFLLVANQVFIHHSYTNNKIYKAYAKQVLDIWNAKAVCLNNTPQKRANQVNQFVSSATRKMIQDVVTQDDMKETQCTLINCLYFKGLWKYPFSKKIIQKDFMTYRYTPGEIHSIQNCTMHVNMMQLNTQLEAKETSTYTAVRLPYRGGVFYAFIILPKKKGHSALLQLLQTLTLKEISQQLQKYKVDLQLPEFKSRHRIMGIVDGLKGLGMKEAFDKKLANFKGITGNQDLFLTQIIHEAVIEVDRTGTKASASTAILFTPRSCIPQSNPLLKIECNRPFLFYICSHTILNRPIFQGTVVSPQSNKK